MFLIQNIQKIKPVRKKKYITKDQALEKLQHYCAYQDRCHQEVRTKLIDLGIYGDDLDEIMADLIVENFLNEERFARSFARGKFRMKKWGRIKIRQELKRKNISGYCLRKGLEEIEEEDYLETLNKVLEKKYIELLRKEKNDYKRRSKLGLYAIQRGFESPLVWEIVRENY